MAAGEEVEGEHEELTLERPDVVEKYRVAGGIAQAALEKVRELCVAGAKVADVCAAGDSFIEEETSKSYNSKKKSKAVKKGVAFPTCVCSGSIVAHLSPLPGDEDVDGGVLVEGELCRVDLGVHIDGFCATVSDTLRVGGEAGEDAEEQGKVVAAAHQAAEIALRLIKPGNTNTQVTEAIASVAETFGVKPMRGVLTHQIKQFVLDGNKVVLQDDSEEKVDEVTFSPFEAYALDICFTTSEEGVPAESSKHRTTVYKRIPDHQYALKLKSSRWLLNHVQEHFASLPFSLRNVEDQKQARSGIIECEKHDLLYPYPVLVDKGAHIARFKFTVLLLPNGSLKLTGTELPAFAAPALQPLPDALQAIRDATPYVSKKTKKKKKKAKKPAAAE